MPPTPRLVQRAWRCRLGCGVGGWVRDGQGWRGGETYYWCTPPKKLTTNMTGWKIHHEWVDVFPIEKWGDFPAIVMWSWTQGCTSISQWLGWWFRFQVVGGWRKCEFRMHNSTNMSIVIHLDASEIRRPKTSWGLRLVLFIPLFARFYIC